MSNLQTPISPELAAYIRSVSLREPELLRRLREETAPRADAGMQVSPEQGQFLGMLVRLMGARRHWRWVCLRGSARCTWRWPCRWRGA